MVAPRCAVYSALLVFQYSLCRVVLMVVCPTFNVMRSVPLSVLALSSRFDGHLRTLSISMYF